MSLLLIILNGSNMITVIFWVSMLALYFLPTIVAERSKKENLNSIFVVNFFLGWTLIGWVIALAWAFAHDNKK